MALVKNSLFYCRYFNYYIYKQPKVLSGWLSVKQFQTQAKRGEANEKVVAKLRKKDDIPKDYNIIYRAPYEIYCKVCYGLAAFSTTVFPSIFTTLLYTEGLNSYPIMVAGIEMAKSGTELAIFGCGLVVVILQVGSVIFRYPYRIYHSSTSNKYILVFQHLLPWKNQKEELSMGELRKIENSIMPWSDSLYAFKNRKIILLDDYFHRPMDLELMMKAPSKRDSE